MKEYQILSDKFSEVRNKRQQKKAVWLYKKLSEALKTKKNAYKKMGEKNRLPRKSEDMEPRTVTGISGELNNAKEKQKGLFKYCIYSK